MNKVVTPAIRIDLDEPRHLRFDFNAFVHLEDAFNLPIKDVLDLLAGPVKLRNLATIIWAGLLHEAPALTVDEVFLILPINDLKMVSDKVREAIEIAFAKGDGSEKKEGGPAPVAVS